MFSKDSDVMWNIYYLWKTKQYKRVPPPFKVKYEMMTCATYMLSANAVGVFSVSQFLPSCRYRFSNNCHMFGDDNK